MFNIPVEFEHDPEFHAMLTEELGLLEQAERADALWLAGAKAAENGVKGGVLGKMVMQMPKAAWIHYKVQERADLGSKADQKTILKLHPQAAVKSLREKIGVGWTPEK